MWCVFADGTPWAQNEGQDFIEDHSSPDIDFAVFHMWPDNWQVLLGPSLDTPMHVQTHTSHYRDILRQLFMPGLHPLHVSHAAT